MQPDEIERLPDPGHPAGMLAKSLVDAIDAHVRSESNGDGYQDVAKRAGMSKQQLANLRRKVAADPGHVINSDVAERLAAAIGCKIVVTKEDGL